MSHFGQNPKPLTKIFKNLSPHPLEISRVLTFERIILYTDNYYIYVLFCN